MADWFSSLDSRERAQFFNSFRLKSKEKRGGEDKPDQEEKLFFDLMSGDPSGNYQRFKDFYDNIILPAWKSFAPKYAGKTPCPSVRALMAFRLKFAEAMQALFRYRITAFDYRGLVSGACMDVWAFRLGIGYVRHEWSDSKGLTVSNRIAPRDVFWDHTASSIAKAQHVIERHCIKRGDFIKKFGPKVGWEVDATKESAVDWPKGKQEHEGKTVFDDIEYFLMWSKEGGNKRVYAFTENDEHGILNGKDGEKWPITFGDEDWHITDLRLTKLPGKINGVSPIWAADGQHNSYQRLNAAVFYSELKSGKSFGFFPDDLSAEMEKIELATRTFNPVPYDPESLPPGMKLSEAIEMWDMPPTPPTLLQARSEALSKWRGTMSLNAVQMMEAQNVDTATEAQTLQNSAANLTADDQGAVEHFTTEIFRKEAVSDASRMPTRSIVCWTVGDYEDEPEGEFEDDEEELAEEPDENLIPDVPYEDAVRLETGVVSQEAARTVAGIRQQKQDEAEFSTVAGGGDNEQVEQAKQQAASMVPQTPEMAVRAQYGVPMDAKCRIVNPGVEQYIGPQAAQGWVEGLTPRQLAAELGISIEPGSSSPTERMQDVNEVLMLLNAAAPILLQFGQYDAIAALLDAAFKKSQIADLDDVHIDPQAMQQYVQQQQQAQAEQAQAEAQARQPAGDDPEVVRMQAESENLKARLGWEGKKEETKQLEMKGQQQVVQGQIDQARDRTKSAAQQQMGMMKP